MPRSTFTPKEPITKLPLAVRKERTSMKQKKGEIEARIATALKITKFTFNLNPNKLWAYNTFDQNAGNIYVEGFANALDAFIEYYGEEGVSEFNTVVTKAELTVTVNEEGEDAPTITARVQDGVFQILFQQERLGYNTSLLGRDEILTAVDSVHRQGLAFEAKASITQNWKPECDDVRGALAEILDIQDIKLDPNFKDNYEKVSSEKEDDNSFKRSFGAATLAYFEGLKNWLESNKVKGDGMVQEAIRESLSEKIIKLRVVDKVKNGYYCGVAFQDGVLYLETTPTYWYTNTSDIAEKLIDLL
ncbi:hypothetical protein NP233_g4323 [Leucocoprinus birnbaumii]|uniref:Uncharacterized protein n=1 Tax=Leucocoprinus birnbaumii TaxID=56174 RepID=A0AAD5YXP0_9AGAR|nr:hypothetical protein NP233_g4323 [Leucocoprinus birnbaumii]